MGYHELKASLRALDLPAKLLEGIEPRVGELSGALFCNDSGKAVLREARNQQSAVDYGVECLG